LGDDQQLGLPGGRRVSAKDNINQVVTDPRGATTPFDYANKQGISATAGVTRVIVPGTELIIDGGVRQKNQQAAFFSPFGDSGFKATLMTFSLTPRLTSQHDLGGRPGKLLTGIDLYDNTYGSHPTRHLGHQPNTPY